ncbi:MAG: serine hydrolase [Dehalococcoidales bacterium]|nr:serine hydrolase [Dehalococcoidales bacterium]
MWKKLKAAPASSKANAYLLKGAAILVCTICLACAVLPACSPGGQITEESTPTDKFEQMDALVAKFMTEDSIPGVSVVVVKEDETVYAKGYGITSIDDPKPVDENTLFVLASVSKSFTALGVLLLRDGGIIDIDKPVVYYVPDFSLSDTTASSKITIRHLLTHTSGIPGSLAEPQGYFDGPDAMAEMVSDLGGLSLNNPPGDTFEYSNLNYFLLGAVVEAATGQTFENYMEKAVFEPLGLNRTTLDPAQAEAWGRAYGHQPVFGQVVQRSMPVFRSALPAGWVMSNARDMGRWLSLFLNGGTLDGEQVVKSETIEEMLTPATYYRKDGHKVGYGMGWLVDTGSNGIKRIWHGGDTPSFLADMMLLPDYSTGITVILNSQTSTRGHLLAPGLANLFLDIEMDQLSSPWWAHWKTIDSFSFGLFSICFILLAGLAIFIWRLVCKIRCRQYTFFKPHIPATWLPKKLMVLYNIPLAAYCLLIAVGYVVFKLVYGYNIFKVIGDTLLVAPPSIWAAGISVLGMIALWSLTLSTVTIIVRRNH